MFNRLFTVAILAFLALVAFAEPIPKPTPVENGKRAPELALDKRQDLSDILGGATSLFGDVTSGVGGVFTAVTCERPLLPERI